MRYMRLLMDADCLIKLTKAGLKELVATHDEITIPEAVRKEVVEAGKDKGLADAALVEKNIEGKRVQIAKGSHSHQMGDEALIEAFGAGSYDAVATDDRKLIRILRAAHVAFVVPGIILYSLTERGLVRPEAALKGLDQLADFISEDEYSTVRLLLEEKS
jgi:rRNA-processing protein FCF1